MDAIRRYLAPGRSRLEMHWSEIPALARVDPQGIVLEEILQKRRHRSAARRVQVVLLKCYGFALERIITDELRSYDAAKANVAPGLDQWSHKGLNNRAKNGHLPFRKRQRTTQGQRSPAALQRFVSMHPTARNYFSAPSRRNGAQVIHYHRLEAFDARKMPPVFPEIRVPRAFLSLSNLT